MVLKESSNKVDMTGAVFGNDGGVCVCSVSTNVFLPSAEILNLRFFCRTLLANKLFFLPPHTGRVKSRKSLSDPQMYQMYDTICKGDGWPRERHGAHVYETFLLFVPYSLGGGDETLNASL